MKIIINKILFYFFFSYTILNAGEPSWQITGEMKYPVSGSVAVVQDSSIYVIGGYSDSLQANVRWIQQFDPVSGQWSIVARMIERRYGFFAGIYNNKLYIYGGINEVNENSFLLEEWDFTSSTTSIFATNELFDRVFPTGEIHNDNLLMIGGYAASRGSFAALPYITDYNFQTFQITSIDDTTYVSNQLPIQQMSTKVENKLFIFGGAFNGVLQSIDLIDMDNFYSAQIENRLISPRAGGVALYSAYSDKIFLIGGYNETTPAINSTEVISGFDIELMISQGPSLNHPRRNLSAVVFNDRIFVFGGENANGKVIDIIEELQTEPVSVVSDKILNYEYQLHQNFPNPFNPATNISFSLSKGAYVQVDIFNLLGQKINSIFEGYAQPGTHVLRWTGQDFSGSTLPTGIYFYRLKTKSNFITKKMLLLK